MRGEQEITGQRAMLKTHLSQQGVDTNSSNKRARKAQQGSGKKTLERGSIVMKNSQDMVQRKGPEASRPPVGHACSCAKHITDVVSLAQRATHTSLGLTRMKNRGNASPRRNLCAVLDERAFRLNVETLSRVHDVRNL